jgi:hypothetical protein
VNILNRITSAFLIEAIILCNAASYILITNSHSYANIQSTASLVIFNLLFVFLMFQLHGSLNRKLGLLAMGNLMGFCWNFVFNFFNIAGVYSFGENFNILYMVVFPFLSSLWMVSFWSLSLTVLRYKTSVEGSFI